jgi:hypothetical protein
MNSLSTHSVLHKVMANLQAFTFDHFTFLWLIPAGTLLSVLTFVLFSSTTLHMPPKGVAGREFFICRRIFFFSDWLNPPPFLPNAVCFCHVLCFLGDRVEENQAVLYHLEPEVYRYTQQHNNKEY